ncbi:hypothetical protein HMPREF0044_0946 [Gleimia coleocanis DSM 15436]|uniref:Uncharacterized protein n=1 Tax=Gleimia coleocanis DSM 15436 TaxID=525245 RepID=C0W068_9ACTO|nr:hypothetical protein HMPREF0044_0946 [Gleimia coleocanis DSM 15436]
MDRGWLTETGNKTLRAARVALGTNTVIVNFEHHVQVAISICGEWLVVVRLKMRRNSFSHAGKTPELEFARREIAGTRFPAIMLSMLWVRTAPH